MNRALAYVVGVLLALAALLGYGLYRQIGLTATESTTRKAAEDREEQAAKARKRTENILATVRAEKATEVRKTAQVKQALDRALAASPAWSEAEVPPEVQKALGGALGGLGDVSETRQ